MEHKKQHSHPTIQRLEAALSERNIKLSQFCDSIEISRQAYQGWKTRGIPGSRMWDIAREIGVDAQWLAEGVETAPSPYQPGDDVLTLHVDKLEALMKNEGLTKTGLAAELKLTRKTLYEAIKHRLISRPLLEKICAYFNVEESHLAENSQWVTMDQVGDLLFQLSQCAEKLNVELPPEATMVALRQAYVLLEKGKLDESTLESLVIVAAQSRNLAK